MDAHNATKRSPGLPFVLHRILDEVEKEGNEHIISWVAKGKAFKVHDKEAFTQQIMPRYFETSTWKSYQRNINLWNFHTIRKGNNKGYTTHPCFRRGDIDLCKDMTRVRVKGTGKKRGSTSSDHEAAAASPTFENQPVSHMPDDRSQTMLANLAALYQRPPPHPVSLPGSVKSSESDIPRPRMTTSPAGASAVVNGPWLGAARSPTAGGGAAFANVTALSQILAATNGIRAQNGLLTAWMSQQQKGLERCLIGLPPTAPNITNYQHQDAIMAGLWRLAGINNSQRQEAPPAPT